MSALPDTDARLRRLRYRAWHRGFREADLVLGPFADTQGARLDVAQLGRLETLLDQPDQDLYDWIVERADPPPAHDHDVLALIRAFRFSAHAARTGADA